VGEEEKGGPSFHLIMHHVNFVSRVVCLAWSKTQTRKGSIR